jgi:hypothetical protein
LRRALLDRFGVFGVRFCVAEIHRRGSATGVELAQALVVESGLDALRGLIDDLFLPQAHVLKARTALLSLRLIAGELERHDSVAAHRLAAEIERCEASSPDFAELRLSHLVLSGIVAFNDDQRQEFAALRSRGGTIEERLGGILGTDHGALRESALAGVERWRTNGAAPMADVAMKEACETMAHTYENLLVELHGRR